jgi:hypothetical protein
METNRLSGKFDEIKEILPPVSCVYFVYSGDELVYIGKAKNLKNRFKTHHHASDFQSLDFAIEWKTMSEPEIKSEEIRYIREYTPRLNGKMYSGDWSSGEDTLPPVAFRPFRRVWAWLKHEPNRTAIINAALEQYRIGAELDDKIIAELARMNVNLEELKELLKGEKQDDTGK